MGDAWDEAEAWWEAEVQARMDAIEARMEKLAVVYLALEHVRRAELAEQRAVREVERAVSRLRESRDLIGRAMNVFDLAAKLSEG